MMESQEEYRARTGDHGEEGPPKLTRTSRLLRWWCRHIVGHNYVEGECARCGDTLW